MVAAAPNVAQQHRAALKQAKLRRFLTPSLLVGARDSASAAARRQGAPGAPRVGAAEAGVRGRHSLRGGCAWGASAALTSGGKARQSARKAPPQLPKRKLRAAQAREQRARRE